MIILIVVIHVIVCIGLIGLVLIQRGRGAGLVESFQGVESMFGTKTNTFLTKATTILSTLFFITCLSLALLSIKQSRSLLRDQKPRDIINKQQAGIDDSKNKIDAKTQNSIVNKEAGAVSSQTQTAQDSKVEVQQTKPQQEAPKTQQ